jgi:lysozyme family protein
MGNGTAVTFLQRGLNALNHGGKDHPDLVVDGSFGQKTLNAVLACKNILGLLTAIKSLQGARYVEITEKNSSQKDFANGWMGRV